MKPDARAGSADARFAHLILRGALLIAALVSVAAITGPFRWLLPVVPDDTYYYLVIAKQIASAGVSTFDGLTVTNGYHPGWMLLMVIAAKLGADGELLIRVCLAVAFALHLATGLILVPALKHWMKPSLAQLGAALWLVNPTPLSLALQGMEASLYIFSLSLVILCYGRLVLATREDQPGRVSAAAHFGLSLGLCFLSRTEFMILGSALAIVAFLQLPKASRPRLALTVVGTGLLVTLPWFLFSKLATGSFTQHSGAMKLLWGQAIERDALTRLIQASTYLFGGWLTYPLLGLPGHWLWVRVPLTAALTVGLALGCVRGLRQASTRAGATLALTLLAGTVFTGSLYGWLFSDSQYWYKAQSSLILFVTGYGLVVVVAGNLVWSPRLRPLPLGALAVLAFAALSGLRFVTADTYHWQGAVPASQETLERLVPPAARVGCFNAGIPAYFGRRTIINLDGLVNNEIYDYYHRRAFAEYLDDRQIDYIIDEPDALKRALSLASKPPTLIEVASTPLEGWGTGQRFLWRVQHASHRNNP